MPLTGLGDYTSAQQALTPGCLNHEPAAGLFPWRLSAAQQPPFSDTAEAAGDAPVSAH